MNNKLVIIDKKIYKITKVMPNGDLRLKYIEIPEVPFVDGDQLILKTKAEVEWEEEFHRVFEECERQAKQYKYEADPEDKL